MILVWETFLIHVDNKEKNAILSLNFVKINIWRSFCVQISFYDISK